MPRSSSKSDTVYSSSSSNGTMDDFSMPSPSNSFYYAYEPEQYLDSQASESQSPSGSLYDMAPGSDYNGMSNVYPSPEREVDELQPAEQQKPAAKRKRENRYKNAPPSVLSRRRAQNRASQRAYRERKDQRIKDLEQMLSDAKQSNEVLGQAYRALQAEYMALKSAQFKDQTYHADLAYSQPMGMPTASDELNLDLYVYSDMQSGYSL